MVDADDPVRSRVGTGQYQPAVRFQPVEVDTGRRGLDDGAETALGSKQLVFGLPPIGNIPRKHHKASPLFALLAGNGQLKPAGAGRQIKVEEAAMGVAGTVGFLQGLMTDRRCLGRQHLTDGAPQQLVRRGNQLFGMPRVAAVVATVQIQLKQQIRHSLHQFLQIQTFLLQGLLGGNMLLKPEKQQTEQQGGRRIEQQHRPGDVCQYQLGCRCRQKCHTAEHPEVHQQAKQIEGRQAGGPGMAPAQIVPADTDAGGTDDHRDPHRCADPAEPGTVAARNRCSQHCRQGTTKQTGHGQDDRAAIKDQTGLQHHRGQHPQQGHPAKQQAGHQRKGQPGTIEAPNQQAVDKTERHQQRDILDQREIDHGDLPDCVSWAYRHALWQLYQSSDFLHQPRKHE